MLAIASKFLIRSNGKHFFNPATLVIVILLLLSPDVWVSPGQWGQSTWLGLLLVCSGGLVLQRAGRADTAVAFLSCYAGLLFWRAWVLGDPLAIPLNQLQSGALLLFSFFMITDPRFHTGPSTRSNPVRGFGRASGLLAAVPVPAAPRAVLCAGGDVAADADNRPHSSGAPHRLAAATLHDV